VAIIYIRNVCPKKQTKKTKMNKKIIIGVVLVLVIILVLVWYYRNVKKGMYFNKRVQSQLTGHCLGVVDGVPDLNTCANTTGWTYKPYNGEFVDVQSGLCLDIGSSRFANSCTAPNGPQTEIPKLVLKPCNGAISQKFTRHLDGEHKDEYRDKYMNQSTGTCLSFGENEISLENCRSSFLSAEDDPRTDTPCNLVQKWTIL
jgi:hypothetical protein